ncbi:LysM domain [Musa troglodytarum]|uniref:LysM domain n=1 Tax=Musa troglodytarum TaxID=320322 RepID=A0A9E7ESM4_9LILI|nr:LysM domain [Musa troglodytarum]
MAGWWHTSLLLFIFLLLPHGEADVQAVSPMECPKPSPVPECSAFLYVVPRGHNASDTAARYSADASLVEPIRRPSGATDFLVAVPCACVTAGNATALFHDTVYPVQPHDTASGVTDVVFSGLAWQVPEDITDFVSITVRLPCGCSATSVVSYAVQSGDTLTSISHLLDSDVEAIKAMNPELMANPDYLNPGQLLFVPMDVHGSPPSPPPPPPPKESGMQKTAIIILSVSLSVLFMVFGGLLICFCRRRRRDESTAESLKATLSKNSSARFITALQSQLLPSKSGEGTATFTSERPVTFSLEEVDRATASFHDSRKIGEGGYGSVYLGILGTQEVAIKKMKSSKSEEFFAELNVLCKVHHRNVVELIGYAAGDDHLYLVYEYLHNGSLSDHLHDPLLKGHQPLSWTARTQIGLDAARGIEYIHEHTKATCVHRDIKTSNILLDSVLRAKVADFGLAKLVEQSDEDWCFATRLVGTPGYLPPESVRELQMSTKSDVFAFGVVLAELVTGERALIPDKREACKMRSLVTAMKEVSASDDPNAALEEIIDRNLDHVYPMEQVRKMVDMTMWCLSDDPVSRPEMREITAKLSQIVMASIEWEASLGGNSQVFSGIFTGR